jgi:hypothetical protein
MEIQPFYYTPRRRRPLQRKLHQHHELETRRTRGRAFDRLDEPINALLGGRGNKGRELLRVQLTMNEGEVEVLWWWSDGRDGPDGEARGEARSAVMFPFHRPSKRSERELHRWDLELWRSATACEEAS